MRGVIGSSGSLREVVAVAEEEAARVRHVARRRDLRRGRVRHQRRRGQLRHGEVQRHVEARRRLARSRPSRGSELRASSAYGTRNAVSSVRRGAGDVDQEAARWPRPARPCDSGCGALATARGGDQAVGEARLHRARRAACLRLGAEAVVLARSAASGCRPCGSRPCAARP